MGLYYPTDFGIRYPRYYHIIILLFIIYFSSILFIHQIFYCILLFYLFIKFIWLYKTNINRPFGKGNHTTYLWYSGGWFMTLFYPHYWSTYTHRRGCREAVTWSQTSHYHIIIIIMHYYLVGGFNPSEKY